MVDSSDFGSVEGDLNSEPQRRVHSGSSTSFSENDVSKSCSRLPATKAALRLRWPLTTRTRMNGRLKGWQCEGVLTLASEALMVLHLVSSMRRSRSLLPEGFPNVFHWAHEVLTPRHFRYSGGTVIMFG